VTTYTVSADVVVIEIGRHETDRGMAVVARIAARDVGCILAQRDRAIMAAYTGPKNLQMINFSDRSKRHSRVTVLARIGGCDMTQMFPGCTDTVVTADAVPYDTGMFEERWKPARCLVAGLTFFRCPDMIRRFADREDVIVTV